MYSYITAEDVRKSLGTRPANSHKGENGRGLLLAGSPGFTGAAVMAAAAALRAGIGTLKVLCPADVRPAFYVLPEAMVHTFSGGWDDLPEAQLTALLEASDCLALGPGVGRKGIKRAEHAALGANKPLVLDADGLNALSEEEDKSGSLHERVLLTPHIGEMARLTGLPAAEIKADVPGTALRYAKAWGCVVMLKDAQSAVAAPDGRCVRNRTGNPGLAKGGSGDVLTGIALAMLGQGLEPFEAACATAYLLGASADTAVDILAERMLMARDVVDMVAQTVEGVWEKT